MRLSGAVMAVVGAYSLHLYCDRDGQPYGEACPHSGTKAHRSSSLRPDGEIDGHNERACMSVARKRGWKFFNKNTIAICPDCVKEGYKWQ